MIEHDLESLEESTVTIISSLAERNEKWKPVLEKVKKEKVNVHLAILKEPYLTYILEGKKTIESRFTKKKLVPYDKVDKGDVIFLKKSSGNIVGACIAKVAMFYNLNPAIVDGIRRKWNSKILADAGFWMEKTDSNYATLIEIYGVERIEPITLKKSDRRPWIVLSKRKTPGIDEWIVLGTNKDD